MNNIVQFIYRDTQESKTYTALKLRQALCRTMSHILFFPAEGAYILPMSNDFITSGQRKLDSQSMAWVELALSSPGLMRPRLPPWAWESGRSCRMMIQRILYLSRSVLATRCPKFPSLKYVIKIVRKCIDKLAILWQSQSSYHLHGGFSVSPKLALGWHFAGHHRA